MDEITALFSRTLPRDEFAEVVKRQMTSLGVSDLSLDSVPFTLRSPSRGVFELSNVYELYRLSAPKSRAEVISEWVDSVLSRIDIPKSFSQASPHLMPMIRPSEEQSLASLRYGSVVEFVDRPFPSSFVCVSVVYDTPKAVSRISRNYVEKWGVETGVVWNTAMQNLRLRLADEWLRIHSGVFTSMSHDGFDATRCLFPDLLRRVPLSGSSRIFMIPERDTLLVSDGQSTDSLEWMTNLGLKAFEAGPYSLTPQPFELRGDDLIPYSPPSLLNVRVENAKATHLARVYQEQVDLLEPLIEEDVFVARLIVAEKNEKVTTYCVWAESVARALLPRADVIIFRRLDNSSVYVSWDDAMRVVGPLERIDLVPARFSATMFPSSEQMIRLAEVAVPKP
jgi:uncharacterized protein YtpQ (UPF0354 family)